MYDARYVRFHDPGHSWLAVEKKELETLGIADQISEYSYMKGELAYLEEDCDMNLFLTKKGITKREAYEQSVKDVYGDAHSFVRKYKAYRR